MFAILCILACFFATAEASCNQNLVFGKMIEGNYSDPFDGAKYLTNCNNYLLARFIGTTWFALNLTDMYLVGKIIVKTFQSKASSYYAMTMNNFDKVTNPPDPSVHYVCPTNITKNVNITSTNTNSGTEFTALFDVYESDCTQSPDMKGYQYVAFWFNSTSGLTLSEIEVYPAPNITETTTMAHTTHATVEVSKMSSARNTEKSATKMTQKAPTTKGENFSAADAIHCCFPLICIAFFIALFM